MQIKQRGSGTPTWNLVLASGSPRRRELLAALDVRFSVRPVEVDESPDPREPPEVYVERLARTKARAATRGEGELILGADTTVVLDGRIMGKPADEEDARRMLLVLAGRKHQVLTGIALRASPGAREASEVVRTEVELAPLEEADVDWYVATGEPMDKAGGYAIQGLAALFLEGVVGDPTNVVGLPLRGLFRLFHRFDLDLRDFRS